MIFLYIGIALIVVGAAGFVFYRWQASRKYRVYEDEMPKSQVMVQNEEDQAGMAFRPASMPESTPEPDRTPPAWHRTASPPAVTEISSLSEHNKSKLMNAVWYRCENPDCSYTEFLDVHHIVPEIVGGSNRLDNLIVLCSRCMRAVADNEIPDEVLRSWIKDRSDRLKAEIDWPYK